MISITWSALVAAGNSYSPARSAELRPDKVAPSSKERRCRMISCSANSEAISERRGCGGGPVVRGSVKGAGGGAAGVEQETVPPQGVGERRHGDAPPSHPATKT